MRLLAAVFLMLYTQTIQAQKIQPDGLTTQRKNLKNYFGVKVGGQASGFGRAGAFTVPVPGKNALTSWHAGLSRDLLTQKHYNSRIELSYITKGARETFGNDRINIESISKLRYMQVSVLPLIIRSDFKNVNPYLGIGGYYARRIGIKSQWKPGNDWENDIQTASNLDVKNDFGYSVSVGIYAWRRPFAELRYEGGLTSISSLQKIKNQAFILSISI
jgi:hypothetical protein